MSPKEFDLLFYMAQRPDRVLTHRTLLAAIWGAHAIEQPESLRVLVWQLRKKIELERNRGTSSMSHGWASALNQIRTHRLSC